MAKKKTLLERLKAKKRKPGELTHGEWLKTAEGQAHLRRIGEWVERIEARDRELGYGDGEYYRVVLEVREATGLDIETIGEMDAAEFDKLASAILRKRKTPKAIPADKRTKAMSKVEALNYIGWPEYCRTEKQARKWFDDSIADGEYHCEATKSQKRWVFHIDDFPEEARKAISKL